MDRRNRNKKIVKAMGYKKHRKYLKNRDREMDRRKRRKKMQKVMGYRTEGGI